MSNLRAASALVVLAGCAGPGRSSIDNRGLPGAGGATATGAGGAPAAASGLPTPPGGGVPRPAGAPGDLTVLDWAGFKAAVSFTFDDSQPSHIAHYAELQAVGVPMTFYVNSGNSGLAGFDATWAQAARDGHEIGNHTAHHCHADLTGCVSGTSLGDQGLEMDDVTSYITRHTPQPAVWTMAAPFGDTGWAGPARTRFFLHRGVGSGMIGPNDATDPFALPIHMAATGETASSFDAATDAARAGGKWLIFLIHSITPTADSWYNPVAIADVTGGMSHARSLADVWTGTVVSVGAYWRGQKVVSAVTPTTSGGDRTWTWTLPAHFPAGKLLRVKVGGGTLRQGGVALAWSDHGYYEMALDAGSVTLSP